MESARIDGAGELRILLRIVLPLSKAVIAVIALFYAVGYWNNFFNAMLYLNDSTKWPMPQVLNEYVLQGGQLSTVTDLHQAAPPSQTVQMAVVVIATVPILAVYPFAQRYFTKGVLTGAIKG
jgi:ABC-type glycerol-3-phosphate transport system permease component